MVSLPQTPALAPHYSHDQLPVNFGRYELIKILGVGGMGTVYLAEDRALQRRVALKIPHRALDATVLQRLLEEARAASVIQHPNVCALYDIGREAGRAFLTMEFVEGKTLDQYVAPGKPMHPVWAAKIVIKIAEALHAAHQQGVIHRDLKPANILVRKNLQPVITDFGLAHRCGRGITAQRAGRVLGSPAYMSPEQVRGDDRQIGPATDVYGLGTILYESLTGQRPFHGQVPTIYSQVLTQPPPAPSRIVPGIDPRLDRICLRALSKSPRNRYRDVLALARELADCLERPQRAIQQEDAVLAMARPSTVRSSTLRSSTLRSSTLRASRLQPSGSRPSGLRPIRSMSPLGSSSGSHRRPSSLSLTVGKLHRWCWLASRQRTGFAAGLLAATVLFVGSMLGVGSGIDLPAEARFFKPLMVSLERPMDLRKLDNDRHVDSATPLEQGQDAASNAPVSGEPLRESGPAMKRYGRATDRPVASPASDHLANVMLQLSQSMIESAAASH